MPNREAGTYPWTCHALVSGWLNLLVNQLRLQLYGEINRLVVQEMPALFLVHRIGMAGVNSRVKGLQLNLDGSPQDKRAEIR